MENKKYDFVIVGGGLYGLTFNYMAKINGFSTLIVERRNHIGGNIYTPVLDEIPIHHYGPHIFHTSNKDIWEFVCSKCEMLPFINSPIAVYKDEVYNLPFNMNTFARMFNVSKPSEVEEIIHKEIENENITSPINLEEQAISMVGKTVYNKLIKSYTEKQWGRPCDKLPANIITRLPYRLTYDNNYYNDIYQGVPKGGYNDLINNLLCDTEVVYDDYLKNKHFYDNICNRVIYTGAIDEYFNYSNGHLEWRTLEFKTRKINVKNYQGNAVINYTSHDVPYTRVIEHKFFDKTNKSFDSNITYITEEYPVEWKPGCEPYYTINDEHNLNILKVYKELAKQELNVHFGGRLGTYQYYDMDDIIESAINDFNRIKSDNELCVWVMTHKDGKNIFDYSSKYKILHVGADINKETSHIFKDNTGDNISNKNQVYCELTGIYWLWKNNIRSKYIGIEHYRRHFDISEDHIHNILINNGIIVGEPPLIDTSIKKHYEICHSAYDIKTLELIVKRLYPEYIKSWDKYIENGDILYPCNMFITSWENFDKLCTFIFTILQEVERIYNIKNIDDWKKIITLTALSDSKCNIDKNYTLQYQLRVCGFMAERLVTLYILHNFPSQRIHEVPIIQDGQQRI